MAREFVVTADGASRGNPGAAAYGATVSENGTLLAELFDVIGIASNNVAEYSGLIAGLKKAHELDPQAIIHVKMDSKLVVEQMSGRWQIKHPDMRSLANEARLAHSLSLVTFQWIPREENSHADRLANKALDSGVPASSKPILNYLTLRLVSDEVPTTIWFVRHGETTLTPTRRFSGSWSDGSTFDRDWNRTGSGGCERNCSPQTGRADCFTTHAHDHDRARSL
jgi:ribonuclease HI